MEIRISIQETYWKWKKIIKLNLLIELGTLLGKILKKKYITLLFWDLKSFEPIRYPRLLIPTLSGF